ncbi:MAG: heme exporter protein CcmB [Gammaproteobacteria bacterium]|nr:heme exporter protein CcmB [Gammaproteobacteria bacterium]MCY4344075.1 heme exporter protein CcmB [Gammaproteobacteria bacterium]
MFAVQFRRDWLCLMRSRDEAVNPLVFLFLATTLFAIAFGGDPRQLAELAPAIVWALVLLANLLSLEALFRRDLEDGTLEQLLLLAEPPFAAVLGKVAVQWCVSGAAMAVLAPVAALLLNLPAAALPALMLGLLLGTPALSLIGAVGAALTVGLRGGGVLLALLLLPLHLPVLVFGVSAVLDTMAGVGAAAQFYWLAAISAAALTLAPFAATAALRISVEQS